MAWILVSYFLIIYSTGSLRLDMYADEVGGSSLVARDFGNYTNSDLLSEWQSVTQFEYLSAHAIDLN